MRVGINLEEIDTWSNRPMTAHETRYRNSFCLEIVLSRFSFYLSFFCLPSVTRAGEGSIFACTDLQTMITPRAGKSAISVITAVFTRR